MRTERRLLRNNVRIILVTLIHETKSNKLRQVYI